MSPTIKTLHGLSPGPIVTIMGGIHGNEPTGVEVVRYLMENLEIDGGTVHLIIANNEAIKQNKRFIDNDLNRAFGSEYISGKEADIARIIEQYLDKSDYLLDLHNTVKNKSPRFSICTDYNFLSTFDVEYCALGISNIHEGCTDQYMHELGKSAICLECGRVEDTIDHNEKTLHDIKNFLATLGVIKNDIKQYTPTAIKFDGIYTTKENLNLIKHFEDFEYITEGTIIGKDGNNNVLFPYDGYIIFAMNQDKAGQEGFIYGKEFTL